MLFTFVIKLKFRLDGTRTFVDSRTIGLFDPPSRSRESLALCPYARAPRLIKIDAPVHSHWVEGGGGGGGGGEGAEQVTGKTYYDR